MDKQSNHERFVEQFAKSQGWLANYKKGRAMIHKLSALNSVARKKMDIGAYRDERVAFAGGAAPPGGTNDLLTENGFYLRVVNKANKTFRPGYGVWYEALVCGTVWQVFLENKIIVLEVDEKDWRILQTM